MVSRAASFAPALLRRYALVQVTDDLRHSVHGGVDTCAQSLRSSFGYNPFGVLDTFSLDDGRSKPYNMTSFLAEITCPLK
jgi:hypothetical protein